MDISVGLSNNSDDMDDNNKQDTQLRVSTSCQQHRWSARGRVVVYKDADNNTDGEEDVDVDVDADGDAGVNVDGEPGIATGRNDEDKDSNAAMEDQIKAWRIKLKMGKNIVLSSSNSTAGGPATPSELDEDVAPQRASARGNAKGNRKAQASPRTRNIRTLALREQVESKESVSNPSDSDPSAASSEDGLTSTTGSALGTTSGSARPMTTQQAVLASMVDSSHVTLKESSRPKKQPLSEMEFALPGWEVPEEYPSAAAIERELDPNVRVQMGLWVRRRQLELGAGVPMDVEGGGGLDGGGLWDGPFEGVRDGVGGELGVEVEIVCKGGGYHSCLVQRVG
ncbi:hypothetical protein FA15DRAFT_727338 [Coprinopsis marcescibilis]|uniref:Uncharacterized protein n=1 Tax=Coprinopsis marcescibilis TaxID=230819 RepID=A0A5C3KH47_COPMA|nr:hypothetical protein FA15DRAFT_727338 [Coprinopsis marcescibilis]